MYTQFACQYDRIAEIVNIGGHKSSSESKPKRKILTF